MVAKDVSAGLTYECLVSDKLVPVRLDRDCPYGGWYGTNLATGHRIRIKTAGRLRKQLTGEIAASAEAVKQDDIIHNTTKEATVPTASTDAKAARAARRSAKSTAAPVTLGDVAPAKPPVASKPVAKNVTPRNAKGQIMSKKSTAKKENTTVKSTTAVKPAAKPATAKKTAAKPTVKRITAKPVATPTVDVDAIVQAAVAAALAEAGVKPATRVAARANGSTKPVAKPVVVKLKANGAKVNSFQFKYVGKDEQPLITAVYVMIPLLEQFAENGDPVEIAFKQYVPSGKQKGQPKSKIRFTGSDDTIRDLYVDRALITKLGYTEKNAPVVTVKVTGEDTITLTIPAA